MPATPDALWTDLWTACGCRPLRTGFTRSAVDSRAGQGEHRRMPSELLTDDSGSDDSVYVFHVRCQYCGREEVSADIYTIRLFQAYHRMGLMGFGLRCANIVKPDKPVDEASAYDWTITPRWALSTRQRRRLERNDVLERTVRDVEGW